MSVVCGNKLYLTLLTKISQTTIKTAQYTHSLSVIQTIQLMLYRKIIAVCSQIHTKHINSLCGKNVELLNVKLAVHRVTPGLERVKSQLYKPVS
jgi:hypothetical protein